jgi:hypothetical protein
MPWFGVFLSRFIAKWLFFPYTPLATVNVEATVNKDEPK